jgi:hypothetical protein
MLAADLVVPLSYAYCLLPLYVPAARVGLIQHWSRAACDCFNFKLKFNKALLTFLCTDELTCATDKVLSTGLVLACTI